MSFMDHPSTTYSCVHPGNQQSAGTTMYGHLSQELVVFDTADLRRVHFRNRQVSFDVGTAPHVRRCARQTLAPARRSPSGCIPAASPQPHSTAAFCFSRVNYKAARYLVAKFAPGIFTSALERQRRPIPDLRRRSAPTSPFRPYEQEAYR